MWVFIWMAQSNWKQANQKEFHFWFSIFSISLWSTWVWNEFDYKWPNITPWSTIDPKWHNRWPHLTLPTDLISHQVRYNWIFWSPTDIEYCLCGIIVKIEEFTTNWVFISDVYWHTTWKGSTNSSNHSPCWSHWNIACRTPLHLIVMVHGTYLISWLKEFPALCIFISSCFLK